MQKLHILSIVHQHGCLGGGSIQLAVAVALDEAELELILFFVFRK